MGEDRREKARNLLLTEIFEADSQIMRLQSQIRELLQKAVDLDIQRLGYVEKITMDCMGLYHYAIDARDKEHRLYPESMYKEGEELYRPPYMEQEPGHPGREQEAAAPGQEPGPPGREQEAAAPDSRKGTKPQEKAVEEKRYYSYMYNADGGMERFAGNSMGEVAGHWRGKASGASGRGKNDTAAYFYVREKNAATGQLGEASRYETATGRDTTPVYLSLPHMSRESFAKTTQYLKENGAKFNTAQKMWYVTRDQDMGRFKQFLPPQARESTVRKLAEGRKEAAARTQDPSARERKQEEAAR
mgnify:FL=1